MSLITIFFFKMNSFFQLLEISADSTDKKKKKRYKFFSGDPTTRRNESSEKLYGKIFENIDIYILTRMLVVSFQLNSTCLSKTNFWMKIRNQFSRQFGKNDRNGATQIIKVLIDIFFVRVMKIIVWILASCVKYTLYIFVLKTSSSIIVHRGALMVKPSISLEGLWY